MKITPDSSLGQASLGIMLGVVATPAVAATTDTVQNIEIQDCNSQASTISSRDPVDCRCVCENQRKPKTVRLVRAPKTVRLVRSN